MQLKNHVQRPTAGGTLPVATFQPLLIACAEQVANELQYSGPASLASVARRITTASTNEVAMAIGWLAHAGRVEVRSRGGIWEIAACRGEPDVGLPHGYTESAADAAQG